MIESDTLLEYGLLLKGLQYHVKVRLINMQGLKYMPENSAMLSWEESVLKLLNLINVKMVPCIKKNEHILNIS